MATAPVVVPMPARGDHSAPRFDPKQPHELCRYMANLQFVFDRAAITNEVEKKQHATRYVDVDTSELWETLDEFSNNAKTFQEFSTAVIALYPGADEEHKWSVTDMDKLVRERTRIGIISLGDLGNYYCQFLTITTFLCSKGCLSEMEQSRAFVHSFPPKLWNIISQRLQLKVPDHFPDNPYNVNIVHEAAHYVLHGTSSAQPKAMTLSTYPATQTVPA